MTDEKELEQFEKSQFEKEKIAEREFEKIEIVEKKMAKKYHEYAELAYFVTYLSSMEKVFARARVYESSQAMLKEDLIRSEMHIFSQDAGLDEEVLQSIKDDFSQAYMTVTQIYAVAEKLLAKFPDDKDCQVFIAAMRDISVTFVEAHEKHFSISRIQDLILKSRMESLAADGHPEMATLEKIYGEFKNELAATGA